MRVSRQRTVRHLVPLVGLAVLLLGGAGASAQTASPVRGTVIDAETRFPLPFASVAVVDTTFGANADARGRFRIDELGIGTWQLRASFIGYEENTITVNVVAMGMENVVIPLTKKLAAGTTEAILITAERNLVDVSEVSTVRRSTAEDIAKLAVDDVGQVVERAVGVSGDNDQLHIRGGRTDETLFRIENVAMKNVVTGAAVGGSFSAKAVESIDVITGGYEAKYGQAISGIVNVKLKEAGYQHRTSAEYYSGSFFTSRYAEPAGSRTTDAHHQLDLSYTQNFPIGDRFNILLRAEVFNVYDNQTGYNVEPRVNDAGYGEPREFFLPRRFQLTAGFQF